MNKNHKKQLATLAYIQGSVQRTKAGVPFLLSMIGEHHRAIRSEFRNNEDAPEVEIMDELQERLLSVCNDDDFTVHDIFGIILQMKNEIKGFVEADYNNHF